MKIAFKILMVFLSIAFVSSQAEAAEANAAVNSSDEMKKLIKLLEDKNILPTTAEGLIHSDQNVSLSRGVWEDSEVAAYQQRFKRKPIVLPFTVLSEHADSTAKRKKKSATSFHYNTVDPQSVYYLYIHVADQPETAKNTLADVQTLLDDNFQSALNDSGFGALNKNLVQLWRVRLGLQEPRFSGGNY